MKLAEIPEIQRTSPEEKIELIDEIWASIPPDSVETFPSHMAELDRRLAALKRNAGKALTPDEARARLKARTGL